MKRSPHTLRIGFTFFGLLIAGLIATPAMAQKKDPSPDEKNKTRMVALKAMPDKHVHKGSTGKFLVDVLANDKGPVIKGRPMFKIAGIKAPRGLEVRKVQIKGKEQLSIIRKKPAKPGQRDTIHYTVQSNNGQKSRSHLTVSYQISKAKEEKKDKEKDPGTKKG